MDKNIERCLSWLEDNLKLTPKEEAILRCLAFKNQEDDILSEDKKKYVLSNCENKSVEEIAFALKEKPIIIYDFLNKYQIRVKRPYKYKLGENDKKYILKFYKTKNAIEIAHDLDMPDSVACIRAFLKNRGLTAKRKKRSAK